MTTRKKISESCVLVGLVLLGVGGFKARGAIDLTPTTGERVLEGIVFKQLIFHEDGRRITYEPPRGWSYSGDASRIRFIPPDIAQAQGEIQQTPLSEPQNLDDARIKALRAEVLASVPKESQQSVVVAEEKNVVAINGSESYEITVAYNLFAQECRLSALFVNLPKTQLQFRSLREKTLSRKCIDFFAAVFFRCSGSSIVREPPKLEKG